MLRSETTATRRATRDVTNPLDLLDLIPVNRQRPAIGHDDQTESAATDFADGFACGIGQLAFHFSLRHSRDLSQKVGGLRAVPPGDKN
jgi:hypothetical protein